MKRFYIIGFLILMSFDTLSQISFKYASTQALPLELSPDWLMRLFLNPWLYGAIAGYLGDVPEPGRRSRLRTLNSSA